MGILMGLKWYNENKDKRNYKLRERWKSDINFRKANKNRQLKNKFGITLDDYNKMFEDQKGCCKTCNRHQTILSKGLVVDHCHKTGKVRGLLCDYCNRLLGNYENKPELFISFNIYLGKQNASN